MIQIQIWENVGAIKHVPVKKIKKKNMYLYYVTIHFATPLCIRATIILHLIGLG